MSDLELLQVREINQGLGYVFTTSDGLKVLSADKIFFDKNEKVEKRKIGVSLCHGCKVGCVYCFTNKYLTFRTLTWQEIVAQVELVLLNKKEVSREIAYTKVCFKQMGDPLINSTNTIQAIKEIHSRHPDFRFTISTSGLAGQFAFFDDLSKLARTGIDIRLQFSCHTTSDEERKKLSPRLAMMDFAEIAKIVQFWQGQPVTLNFVLITGFEYQAQKLAEYFDPKKVFLKINFLDPNRQTEVLGFNDLAEESIEKFVQDVSLYGFHYAYRQH